MAVIQGDYDERFSAVCDALAGSLDDADVGASAAVYLDGELVVDVWGGYVDAERTTAWERDTITNVWSTTKTMTALCALVLADRGAIDLEAPVARYWPEFAAAGKENVLVRHVLSHTAGLPTLEEPTTLAASTTGRPLPRDWPRRRRAGSRARQRATTRSPTAFWSVRSFAGSPAGAWANSSPRRWPGRWARISTSDCPPNTIIGWRP